MSGTTFFRPPVVYRSEAHVDINPFWSAVTMIAAVAVGSAVGFLILRLRKR